MSARPGAPWLLPGERVRLEVAAHPLELVARLAVRAAQVALLLLAARLGRAAWIDDVLRQTPVVNSLGPGGGPIPLGDWIASACGWLLLVVLALAVLDVVRFRLTRYVLTDQRVVKQTGVVVVGILETPLDRVHEVLLVQSRLGQALGYGDLVLLRAGEEGNWLRRMRDPLAFRQAMHAARERRLRALLAPGALADVAASRRS